MNKRKWTILSFLFLLLLLSGCNKDVKRYYYDYRGENENWKAEFIENDTVTFTKNKGSLHVESEAEEVFLLTYKGELSDLSSVRLFEYGYESPSKAGKSSSDYTADQPINTKVFTLRSGSTGGSLSSEDTVYTVTVNMDGVKETFELKLE